MRSQVRVQLQLQLPSTQKSVQCDKTTGWSVLTPACGGLATGSVWPGWANKASEMWWTL